MAIAVSPEFADLVRFDAAGLVTVVAQDAATGVVRMVAFANRDALVATAQTGRATFWSRSRNELWEKGATSGHRLAVRELRLDCDGDAVLYLCDAQGPSCHTGATSCFFRRVANETDDQVRNPGAIVEDDGPSPPPASILTRVGVVVAQRRASTGTKSYVKSLLEGGWPKISGKILEEAHEVVEALPGADPAHTTHEAADVIFHLIVGLEAAGVPLTDVFAELARRFGTSGHVEKANRAIPLASL